MITITSVIQSIQRIYLHWNLDKITLIIWLIWGVSLFNFSAWVITGIFLMGKKILDRDLRMKYPKKKSCRLGLKV